MGLNAFVVPVFRDEIRATRPCPGRGCTLKEHARAIEPRESEPVTTSAEPADVTLEWVDDDGSTVTHYEGEVSA